MSAGWVSTSFDVRPRDREGTEGRTDDRETERESCISHLAMEKFLFVVVRGKNWLCSQRRCRRRVIRRRRRRHRGRRRDGAVFIPYHEGGREGGRESETLSRRRQLRTRGLSYRTSATFSTIVFFYPSPPICRFIHYFLGGNC